MKASDGETEDFVLDEFAEVQVSSSLAEIKISSRGLWD